jgi:hypothetical protein
MLPIGKKQHLQSLSDKCTLQACPSTGSYRRVTSVSETSCFLGTFEISKDFMRQSSKIYHKKNGFRFPEKLVIKLFLV